GAPLLAARRRGRARGRAAARPGADGRGVARARRDVARHPPPGGRGAALPLAAAARGLRDETLRGEDDLRDRRGHRPGRRHDQVAPVPRGAQAARAAGGSEMRTADAPGRHLTPDEIVDRLFPSGDEPVPVALHLAACSECQEKLGRVRDAWILDRGVVAGAVEALPSSFWEAQEAPSLPTIA